MNRTDVREVGYLAVRVLATTLRAWWFVPVIFVGGCAGGIALESEITKQTAPFSGARWGLTAVFQQANTGSGDAGLVFVRVNSSADTVRDGGSFLLDKTKGSIGRVTFRVLSASEDGKSQVIEVLGDSDVAYIWSRYHATANSIEPISRRVFGMGSGMIAVPFTFLCVWLCGRLDRYLNKRFVASSSESNTTTKSSESD
jgi:hypothetical protein